MSDYAIVHNGIAYTPNGGSTPAQAAGIEARNKVIEQTELVKWAGKPARMLAYMTSSDRHVSAERSDPQTVTTWMGSVLGTITSARVYRHNFGGRMVSIRVMGNNGATYYGRASWDNGTCIMLIRCK